jgi:GGDEF domain-containing protein
MPAAIRINTERRGVARRQQGEGATHNAPGWFFLAFFDIAERAILRARRTGRDMSPLLPDIDHFKKINDSRGHAMGDQVLADLVNRAGNVIRTVDYFARIGGEEFAVLLPETPPCMPQRQWGATGRFARPKRKPAPLRYWIRACARTA